MKKTIKLALVASLALGATSAFATNGTSLIGYGAKSRGMGGTGVAMLQGSESGFNNPALIGYSQGTEVSIGGTYFAPDVSLEAKGTSPFVIPEGSYSSTASASMIPAVSMSTKVNDSFAWGLALYGVGGMGVDYRDEAMLDNPGTPIHDGPNDNLLLMRFAVPLTYTVAGFAIGVSPVIEYGALSMNLVQTGSGPDYSAGVTTDIAYGFEVGAAYQIAGVTMGVDYKSAVTHDFKNTFDSKGMTGQAGSNSELDTPQIIAAGVSYEIAGSTIAFDYKNIAYSSAKGFDDFAWNDMNVFALGYEYAATSWAVRVGYNYAEQPINLDIDQTMADSGLSFAQSLGSLMMFPGVTESHYTVGGSYVFSEHVSLDAAFVYGTGSASLDLPAPAGGGTVEATNDQISATVAANFNF